MKIVAPAALAAVVMVAAGCGGTSNRAGQVAVDIGATTCTSSGYGIVSKVDHSKTPIYNCTLHGRDVCVTEENGIAQDSTALVRLLFANTLSGGKPSCVTGR